MNKHDNKDTLFAAPQAQLGPFQFDDHVARVFSDMIGRSVPGYDLTLKMIGVIAGHFANAGTNCYDLGCSLGASTLAMRHNIPADCTLYAVDNSQPMVNACQSNIDLDKATAPTHVLCADIREIDVSNASIATMNFTLQFVPAADRHSLLSSICDGLISGGALVLSEKISLHGDSEQELLMDLHHDFKRAMGYSDLEIAQKRSAIEDVLVPDSLETHKERLHKAGFRAVHTWFQCFNFASLIAIK